jgi:hypothetical protein
LFKAQVAHAEWRLKQVQAQGYDLSVRIRLSADREMQIFLPQLADLNLAVDQALETGPAQWRKMQLDLPEFVSDEPVPADDPALSAYLLKSFQQIVGVEIEKGAGRLLRFCSAVQKDPSLQHSWGAYYLAALRCLLLMESPVRTDGISDASIEQGVSFTQVQPAFLAESAYFTALHLQKALHRQTIEEALQIARKQADFLAEEGLSQCYPFYWLKAWMAHGAIRAKHNDLSWACIESLQSQTSFPLFADMGIILEAIHYLEFSDGVISETSLRALQKKIPKGASDFLGAMLNALSRAAAGDPAALDTFVEYKADPLYRLFSQLELEAWLDVQKVVIPLDG